MPEDESHWVFWTKEFTKIKITYGLESKREIYFKTELDRDHTLNIFR